MAQARRLQRRPAPTAERAEPTSVAVERLQKILAQAGLASRRAAEQLITGGRVRVNGRLVTELGSRADGRRDRIEVDGKRITLERPIYYLMHKPRGVVSTLSDPEGRPSLGELLARFPERLYPVGRLDFHTSGALLITNDGELAEALLHPSRKVPKVYVAKLRGDLDTDALDGLRNGVELDDGFMTAPADVIVLREEAGSTWIRITIHEGKNRQILRMGDAIGHPVTRLSRISFAGLDTETLRPGNLRQLEDKEIEKLKKAYLVPARARKLGQKRSAAHAARQAANAAGDGADGEEDESIDAAAHEDESLDDGDAALDAALALDEHDGHFDEADAPSLRAADGEGTPSYPTERSRTPRVTKRAREMERGVQNARGNARDPKTREGARASAARSTARDAAGASNAPSRAAKHGAKSSPSAAQRGAKSTQNTSKSSPIGAGATRGKSTRGDAPRGRRGISKSR